MENLLNGIIKFIEKKYSNKNEKYYYYFLFEENTLNKKYNIFIFDEKLIKYFDKYKEKLLNYILTIKVKKWNTNYVLIEILDKIAKEENQNNIELKILKNYFIYKNDEKLNEINLLLNEKYFFNEENQKIFNQIKENKFLIENYPLLKNIEKLSENLYITYVNKLIDIYKKRKKEEIKNKIINDEIEITKFIKEEEITDEELINIKNYQANNLLTKNINIIQQYKNRKTLGCPTGFPFLDSITDGIFGLVGLTGVPGSGKTSLGLQITDYNIKKGNPVIYISLEISAKLLLMKWAAFLAEIPMKKILKNYLTYEESYKFYSILDKLLDIENLYIIDKSNLPSFEKIETLIKYVRKKYNENEILVVLDYLNIFDEPSLKDIKDKNEKMANIIKEFIDIKNKTMANFLIILAKNKQGYKIAEMSSIKGDNNLEYGLETIISLEKPESFGIKEDNIDFNLVAVILKNRWGENMRKVPFYFDGKLNKFNEIDVSQLKEN